MICDARESDARIVIDDLLRRAGWDPTDKSMVETEVPVLRPGEAAGDSGALPAGASLTAGRAERALFLVDREQIAEQPPEENPAQMIRETLALEREIVSGLEKLPKELEG